jgi:cytoskeletal protein CcmA (bactofilin family)
MKKLVRASLLLILMLSWATPAFAQGGGEPGKVVFGSDLVLEEGEMVDGDVVLFGGNLEMEDASLVKGNVVVFGGNAQIDGEVDGDLAAIGGQIELGPNARIDGDVASVGGQIDRDEKAYVRGDIIETTKFNFEGVPIPIPPVPPSFEVGNGFEVDPLSRFFEIMFGFAWGFTVALVIAAIGLLVVLFLPEQTETVGRTIIEATPTSFGIGLLTMLVGAAIIFLLFVTCCLIPVGLLLALALALATLYGWIVVGYLLGQRLLQAIQKNESKPTPIASALVGLFTLTLLQQGLMALGNIPCLGFFFGLLGLTLWLLVASTGLGAVVLSRFGTQPYTPTPPALPHADAPELAEPSTENDSPDEETTD